MKIMTQFKDGDLVLPANKIELPISGYLPAQKVFAEIFNDGPLPIKVSPVDCSCDSNNGNHKAECAITQNYEHNQKLLIQCSPYMQIQVSECFLKKANK